MHQTWGKLLFIHWRMDAGLLRPLIPAPLEIDTFDGAAWVAIAPFTMWDVRALPPYLPGVPGFSAMHELNVRTYVHLGRVPGIWFFSLDINSTVATLGARATYFLPYYWAGIDVAAQGETIHYTLARRSWSPRCPPAAFAAAYTPGAPLPEAQPGSLEFFLTERYCLYSALRGRVYRACIYHRPWPLQAASLASLSSTMLEAHRLPTPHGAPLLHYAGELSVDIWPLKRAA
jgi:uncharacterized protein YqjF (DUF2071 family)